MGTTQLRQTKRRMIWTVLFVLGFCCVFTGMALAQQDQGAINGVVKDTKGAVVRGAQVTLTNTDTNFSLKGKTDGNGEYFFSPIKIGHYSVSATAQGFETTTQENITVNIQDRLNIPLTLKLGMQSESIVVSSAPPMLQSENASVGQVMTTEEINNTPLAGRNWVFMAELTAGVDPPIASGGNGNSPNALARGGGNGDFSANGQRTTQNNFVIDGVDNNVSADDLMNGASYNVKPPPDALAEFKIDTSNYSAEFGHSAGAVMNVSIKSGTNKIHGDLWEYLRNNDFDAINWPDSSAPPYHQNQFGATLGLPIWKNKIFYFGDAEANRIVYGGSSLTLTVPTYSEVNGDMSELFLTGHGHNNSNLESGVFAPNTAGYYPLTHPGAIPNPLTGAPQETAIDGNNTTNALNPGEPPIAGGAIAGSATGQMDTVAGEVFAAYPHPNTGGWNSGNYTTPGAGQTYNNYFVDLHTRDDTFQWDQRVDWNISAKDQTYARFSYTHEQVGSTAPLGPVIDGGNDVSGFFGNSDFNLGKNFMFSETHLFNPKLINEFRVAYNWGNFQFLQANSTVPASVLIPGMDDIPFGEPFTSEPNGGLPYMLFQGQGGLSAGGARRDVPSIERENVYQILDNVTKVWGRHSVKFGLELQSIRASGSQSQYPRARYRWAGGYTGEHAVTHTGSGIADAYTDNMASTTASPGWNTSYYRWYRAGYAQDDWKYNQKLTINLGVRYDYIEPFSNNAGDVANFVITSSGISTGTGIWEMSSLTENQNLLPPAFVLSLAQQNVNVQYLNSKSLTTAQKDNFAPRVGFAYQVDSKTVVRSAYGLFFGAIEIPGFYEQTENFPWNYSTALYNDSNCLPSPNAGAQNTASLCQSTGVANNVNLPYLPYPTTIEYGLNNYFQHGGLIAFAGSPEVYAVDQKIKTPYTQSYNLSIERQLSRDMVASISYVGNNGKHLYTGIGWNDSNALTNPNNPNTNAYGYPASTTNPFPQMDLTPSTYNGESIYNSLQAKWEKRASHGYSFLATYTLSRAGDNSSNPGIGGGPGNYRDTNLIPLKDEFSPSEFDTRQRVTVNGNYELPFGKGRKYVHDSTLLDYLVGGWATSLTFIAQTGQPMNITAGGAGQLAGGGSVYNAILVGNPFAGGGVAPAGNPNVSTCPTSVRNKLNWYNPCAFIDPVSGLGIPITNDPTQYVTGEANAIMYLGGKQNRIPGPGYERVNMSAFKNFKTWHDQFIQFRADAFNLLNHPTWTQPSDQSDDSGGGEILSYQGFQNLTPDARFFQLAAKYVF
jgi:hypothetical protein